MVDTVERCPCSMMIPVTQLHWIPFDQAPRHPQSRTRCRFLDGRKHGTQKRLAIGPLDDDQCSSLAAPFTRLILIGAKCRMAKWSLLNGNIYEQWWWEPQMSSAPVCRRIVAWKSTSRSESGEEKASHLRKNFPLLLLHLHPIAKDGQLFHRQRSCAAVAGQ